MSDHFRPSPPIPEEGEILFWESVEKNDKMEWIAVEERVPNDYEYVLVCCATTERMWVAFYHDVPVGKGFLPSGGIDAEPTHWMPLPELPTRHE